MKKRACRTFVAVGPLGEDAVRSVVRPIEVPAFVGDGVRQHGTGNLSAEIAERNQIRCHRPLSESQIAILPEGFKADWLFELADANFGEGKSLQLQEGFLNLRVVLSKVRHEAEIHVVEERAFEQGTNAAEQEGVDFFAMLVRRKHAIVGLNVAMNLNMSAAIIC